MPGKCRWDSSSIRQMYESGAKGVASSDSGSTATRIDEFVLLLDFLVNRLEIPAMQVITSATSLAAVWRSQQRLWLWVTPLKGSLV